MADQQQPQQQRQQRQDQGRGQQQPKSARITHFDINGSPSNFTFELRALTGDRAPVPSAGITFRLGTPDHPLGEWIMDPADPSKKYRIFTDTDGWAGSISFSLDDVVPSKYSQVTAVCGSSEVTRPFPPPDPAVKAPAKPKGKRLKVSPEDDEILSVNNRYNLRISTFDKDGKPEGSAVHIRADGPVTVKDASAGTTLANGVRICTITTPAAGLTGNMWVEISFTGALSRSVTLIHPDSLEEQTKKLKLK